MATTEQMTRDPATDVQTWTCSVCMTQGAFTLHPVDEVIVVGDDAVIVTVEAAECGVCGNRTYAIPAVERMEQVRAHLDAGDRSGLRAVGTTYRAPAPPAK